MPNVKYFHPVFENSVEDFVWIANERHDTHTWALGNRRCGLRMLSYVCDSGSNSQFDRGSDSLAKCSTIGSDFA
jgi:hypothetical protein